MTGYDIFNSAAVLIGAQKGGNEYNGLLPEIALCAVNRVGSDLLGNFELRDIFDTANVPPAARNAFIHGVASALCAALEKSEQSAYFTRIYNAERAAVKSNTAAVINVIPAV